MKWKFIEPTRVVEPWAEAHLPNGDVVKVRLAIAGVVMQIDEDGMPLINETGQKTYGIQAQQLVISVNNQAVAKTN